MNDVPDWGGLGAIIEEAREIERDLKSNPSPACPTCGEPLQVNARGIRNCPMGHYRDNGYAAQR